MITSFQKILNDITNNSKKWKEDKFLDLLYYYFTGDETEALILLNGNCKKVGRYKAVIDC